MRPRPRPRPESVRLRPRPKNCYETETKNYETETNLVNSVAYESKTNRYAFVVDYIFEIINDE